MTEKPGAAYPPLSDEDLARYGGPPELAYLPLVNMANELIAARARLSAAVGDAVVESDRQGNHQALCNALERERALGERFEAARRNNDRLRAEVERLTADLVELEAKRRRAVADADEQLRLHAETHKLLTQSNADHNALLLHLHAIREAAGIVMPTLGPDWGEIAAAVSTRLRELAKLEASRNWTVQGEWQGRLATILGSPDTRDHIEAAAVDARSEIARLTRLKDELLGRLEALCHRLDDNDVHVFSTQTWIDHLEAGIMLLIQQHDGACARREAEETARIKADAQAVFEAQRTDLATAIGAGSAKDWNALVRRLVELRREHAEATTELIAIDRALEAVPGWIAGPRANKIRSVLDAWTVARNLIQDATKKLCRALGIADTATLGFAVETAAGLIGETPRREPKAAASWADTTRQLGERVAKLEATSHLIAAADPHASLPDAPEADVLRAQLAQAHNTITKLDEELQKAQDRLRALEKPSSEWVPAMSREEAERLACSSAVVAMRRPDAPNYLRDADRADWRPHEWVVDAVLRASRRPLMPVSPARAELLREQGDRITALEAHNREMHESVAMALGHERGGAGVGWKDLILEIGSHRASLDEAKRAKSRVAVALGYKADDQSHWDGFVSAIERAVMERQGTFETMKRCTDRLAKIAHACGVDTAVETPWIENISDRIVAAIERQGADLREARQNAEAALARVANRDGQLNATRIAFDDAASKARQLADQLEDIERAL